MDMPSKMRSLLAAGIELHGSQVALAERLNMNQPTLQRILTGKSLRLRSSTCMKRRLDLMELSRAVLPQALLRALGRARITPQELAANARLHYGRVEDFISARAYPSKFEFDALREALGEGGLRVPHESEFELDCSETDRKPLTHLAKIRAQARLTQSQLAALSGVSQRAISSYESGTRSPSAAHLKAIAQALGVERESLLRGLSPGEKPSPAKVATNRLKSLRSLPEDAKELLDSYMALDQTSRRQVMQLLRSLAKESA